MPYDPFDPTRSGLGDDDYDRASRFDNEHQFDPELREGPVSGTRVALFAVGIAVVLGVVFYALNNTSMQQQASPVRTPANSQSSSASAPPAAPRPNSQPGTTTGTAPAQNQPSAPEKK